MAHTGIRITDLERSLRLYTSALGLVEQSRVTMSNGGVFFGLLDSATKASLGLTTPRSQDDSTPRIVPF